MTKTLILPNDKLNPSCRYFTRWKICYRCQKVFICDEKHIIEENLREWEEKIKLDPSLKKGEGPLLCKERRVCLCDLCRSKGGTSCKTRYVQE